ncbi:hypothetical protein GKQ38_02980 [Candidatus Nanohaloarchaea archaeon]|nr:hypothetical protein GKQ38_02980 [Candidatus Nanohaloarchaea archaeon]
MNRKGAGYAIELMVSIFILLAFAAGSFDIPDNQNWSNFQQEVAAQDISYTLKKTGHITHFMKNAEIGSLKTAITTISGRNMHVSGTVSNLPILETSVGYNVLPKRQYPNQGLQGITDCSGDLTELEEEVQPGVPLRQTDPAASRQSRHNVVLYVGDTDPRVSGGFNSETDYDTVWVDNKTQCQFTNSEGPYYIDNFFLWGNMTDDNPDTYYDIKEIDSSSVSLFKADQPVKMKKMLSREVNGINTRTSVSTFDLGRANLSKYEILVFRDEAALSSIQANRQKVEDFMKTGSVLLLMNLDKSTTNSNDFIQDLGLEWVGMSQGSKSTTCPHTGDVIIDSSNSGCTFGPGRHFLNSLTIESGATAYVENNLSVCKNSPSGTCENVLYSKYAPKIVVEGEVNIDGSLVGTGAGYGSSGSTAYGPGAGGSATAAGGGGYGGPGGSGAAAGGSEYGSSFEAKRPGSAGGYDTDDNAAGGSGGGSVWIQSEEFALSGSIVMDGEDGTADSGGGSGGSIRVESHQVSGSGTLSANGGDASSSAGGGAGGRIFVRSGSGNTNFNIQISGGSGSGTASSGSIQVTAGLVDLANLVGGFTTTVSDEADSYFQGLNGDQRDVSLVPGGWVKSGGAETVTSDNNFFYAINHRYNSDDWNASSWSMSPTSPPPGAPSGSEYTMDTFTFPNGATYSVLNTYLGSSDGTDIRALNVDFNDNGNYGDEGEGPFLQGERVIIANRRYRVAFNNETGCDDGRLCAEFVFAGSDEIELINYRTNFEGFEGQRLARAAYEQSYEQSDVKVLASTLYWLRGDQLSFEQQNQPRFSTEIVGSVSEEVFMPYRLDLRWSNE